jgi:NADH pyrophosphatase NudC (nudix superfamily)
MESLEDGLRRELAEELGFAVQVDAPVAWLTLPSPRRLLVAFDCVAGAGAFRPNAEIVKVAYFPLDEALGLLSDEARLLLSLAARGRRAGRPD